MIDPKAVDRKAQKKAMKNPVLEFEKPIADLEKQIEKLRKQSSKQNVDVGDEISTIEAKIEEMRSQIYANLSRWQRVQVARHYSERPFMLDYVEAIFGDFVEMHGDRHIGDDQAMPCGFATLAGKRCVIIGHQKGRDVKEHLQRNFGSAHPEGYRKALRMMKLAEKFGLPVVSFIDTPGAFPGIGAEERNIAEAIAFNLREMMSLKTPILAVGIGEGGSGGALGIGVADRVNMLENAYYSVIAPEGCAAILWKHRKHAPEAAEAMKLTAEDLKELGVVDEVVPEPEGGAHADAEETAEALKRVLVRDLEHLTKLPLDQLLEERYAKFRAIGKVTEVVEKSGDSESAESAGEEKG
ncbi:MAG: acetyl-CoA carboxylase carboxyltransferase subunit alpha, partial [Verrucomicrobiota bacterium]